MKKDFKKRLILGDVLSLLFIISNIVIMYFFNKTNVDPTYNFAVPALSKILLVQALFYGFRMYRDNQLNSRGFKIYHLVLHALSGIWGYEIYRTTIRYY